MERKRLFVTLLFSFIFISMLASFVSAQAAAGIFDPIMDMFTSWEDGDLSINIARYVIWIIVGLLVYSILDQIPFTKGNGTGKVWVRIILAVAISFLSIGYLGRSDILLIVTSYTAMGIVLGAIVPFVILLFFSMEMHKVSAGGRVLSKVVWVAFIVYLVYKIIEGTTTTPGISTGGAITYLALIAATIAWMWFGEQMLVKALFKEEIEGAAENLSKNFKTRSLAQAASLQKDAAALKEFSGGNKELDNIAKGMESTADKMGK